MPKHAKISMHRGNNRYREFDEMTNSGNELEGKDKKQANCENNRRDICTEHLEEREGNCNDQVTKVAPIRTTHNDPNKKINNQELRLLDNKTAVAKRLPLRSYQEYEHELEDKEQEYSEQHKEQQKLEEEENDVYSNKSIDAKLPSADVFVEESPSHTHVYRLQAHGANPDLHEQQQQQQLLLLKEKEQDSTNRVNSSIDNMHTLPNQERGQQLVSFNNKSRRALQQGSEAGNKYYEEDYNAKWKESEREQEQEQEHTTSHREHNQFYSEVSNLRYDNISTVKKLQNASIFEMNNNADNGNSSINNVNYSLVGNSNTLISKNVTEEEKKNGSCTTYDNSWYSRASHYLLPRIDVRFARDAEYIENENNNFRNTSNSTYKENGNIVEVGIAHCMLSEVRLVLFAALTFVSLIFTIVSLPTSQLDVKNYGCYTYWGYKDNCDDNSYYTPMSLLACTATRWRLQAASAFAVMSLFTLLIAVSISETMIFCNSILHRSQHIQRIMQVALIVGSVAIIIFQLIAWCLVAAVNVERDCDNDSSARRNITYGVGFGFSVTSWCLVICATCIFLITPSSIHCAAESVYAQ